MFAPKVAKPTPNAARAAPAAARRKLAIGRTHDPLEHEADRIAQQVTAGREPLPAMSSAPPPALGQNGAAGEAPAVVDDVLSRPGQPLDAQTRGYFEPRFGRDFSGVRVHADGLAARSAEAVSARAYTVGDQIVFGAGAFAPHHPAGQKLIAHELAHTLQQGRAPAVFMQRQPAAAPAQPAPAPRQDYVFIMGADRKGTNNPFFTEAARYFRAHLPNATMVEDQRSLDDLLAWVAANVTAPIGHLYIVSHGNEDGTLAFGLNSSDADAHMTVRELRAALHPSTGGSSSLHSVGSAVDAQTRIQIKGCDIGRTREIVELLDEAFGGAGTVNAPTHEQKYSSDSTLGEQARHTAHDQKIKAFTDALPALPSAPDPVDKTLKGDARKEAQKAHDEAAKARKSAQAARKTAIAAEETRIKPELDVIAEKATMVQSLSGPMFQHPGTKLFTAAELQPEIDRLYAHLPEARRKQIAAQLVAPDSGGPNNQTGQRVDRVRPYSESFPDPATLSEAMPLYGKDFKDRHFVPKTFTSTPTPDGVVVVFKGVTHPPGEDAHPDTMTYAPQPVPTDASIIANGKPEINNPDRYAWRVERTHNAKTGKTTLTAVGERVMAYLHHGSLDAAPHNRFIRPETDPNFYATSTFTPPPP
ncbi:MAG: DUF4157 domain-containing protein [Phenylobacterium sp.]